MRAGSHATEWKGIDRAGRAYARECPDLLECRLVELHALRYVGIARAREGHAECQYTRGIESGIHTLQPNQTAKQQACSGEQRHAEGDLGGHKTAPQTAVAADAAAAVFAQSAEKI